MMRPVLPELGAGTRRKRHHSSGLGNVFKLIAESFRSQSLTSKHRVLPIVINPTVVGGTPDQRLLFEQIRSASLDVRSEAVLKLTSSINEFSISSISEIWYAAKDLLDMKTSHEVRRDCLLLMANCIDHDDLSSAAIRLMYYEDLITCCNLDYKNSQIDPDFDLILNCLESLTKNGVDIVDFYISERYPLDEFLSLSGLLCFAQIENDLVSGPFETNLVRLVRYMKNCITHNSYLFCEASITKIVQQVISMVLNCSSKDLMIAFLDFTEMIVTNKVVTISLCYSVTEMISYTYSFEKEMSWRIMVSMLQDPVYSQLELKNLCQIVSDVTISNSDDNVTVAIGAIDLIYRVSVEFISDSLTENVKCFMESFIQCLHEPIKLGSVSVNIHILFLLKEVLEQRHELFNNQCWSLEEYSIFDILRDISGANAKENDEIKELLELIHSSMIDLAVRGVFNGYDEQLIKYYVLQLDKITDANVLYVLEFFKSRSLFIPISNDLEKNLSVLQRISRATSRSESIRIKCFQLIEECVTFQLAEEEDEVLLRKLFFELCYYESIEEQGEIILELLSTNLLLNVMLKVKNESIFTDLIDRVTQLCISCQYNSVQEKMSKTFCQLFSLLLLKYDDGFKSMILFNNLIKLTQSMIDNGQYSIALVIAKMFIRIRVRSDDRICFTNPIDIEGLTSAFNRNFSGAESPFQKNLAWYYPESIDYLPLDLIGKPSKIPCKKLSLDMSKWLQIVLKIIENFYEWELYSFIWSHFCPQLSNLTLFISDPPLQKEISIISKLRAIICNQLSSELPLTLKFPDNLGKADLQIAMIRTLTAVIPYHDFFSKAEEDLLIKSTVDGLSTSWEKTAIPSIHFLNLCCYEIPLSVKKYLILILIKLQTRISTFFASPHILEFLMSLSHLPSLSSNFDLEEYKRIFGISFQFIEFCKINVSGKLKHKDEVFVNKHGEDVKVENVPSTEVINITPALSQYLLGLSYSVISSWFLKMKMNERQELKPFIVRNLILSSKTSENGPPDDQTFGFIDFIHRFSLTDLSLKMRNNDLKCINENAIATTWIYDNIVVSIEINDDDIEQRVVVRKPADAGVVKFNMNKELHQHLESIERGSSEPPPLSLILKSLPQDNGLVNYLLGDDNFTTCKELYNTPVVTRSLENLDRLPVVQFCKAGIIYIGESQLKEESILANRFGSLQYKQFLKKVGELIRLKDCRDVYVGGLDTENDLDGEFAILWKDKITQLIFHTTTLMPNNEKDDPGFFMKKRHVGNNYVNIYFDESRLPFDFNLIKSQFNFINIVISPVSPKYFRVKVYRRNGVPSIFAACHFKLISEEKLASFVRNLVLVCNEFSGVWSSDGQYISNWSRRVQYIEKLNGYVLVESHSKPNVEEPEGDTAGCH